MVCMDADKVITLTLHQLVEMGSICQVFKWSILYSWSVLIFYFPADEEKGGEQEGGKIGREKLYAHIS